MGGMEWLFLREGWQRKAHSLVFFDETRTCSVQPDPKLFAEGHAQIIFREKFYDNKKTALFCNFGIRYGFERLKSGLTYFFNDLRKKPKKNSYKMYL
jgi:hypothetical protein